MKTKRTRVNLVKKYVVRLRKNVTNRTYKLLQNKEKYTKPSQWPMALANEGTEQNIYLLCVAKAEQHNASTLQSIIPNMSARGQHSRRSAGARLFHSLFPSRCASVTLTL